MFVVIASHVGELATLNGGFPSSKHSVSGRGAAVFGLLAVVVGHPCPRRGGYAFSAFGESLFYRVGGISTMVLEVDT